MHATLHLPYGFIWDSVAKKVCLSAAFTEAPICLIDGNPVITVAYANQNTAYYEIENVTDQKFYWQGFRKKCDAVLWIVAAKLGGGNWQQRDNSVVVMKKR